MENEIEVTHGFLKDIDFTRGFEKCIYFTREFEKEIKLPRLTLITKNEFNYRTENVIDIKRFSDIDKIFQIQDKL